MFFVDVIHGENGLISDQTSVYLLALLCWALDNSDASIIHNFLALVCRALVNFDASIIRDR